MGINTVRNPSLKKNFIHAPLTFSIKILYLTSQIAPIV